MSRFIPPVVRDSEDSESLHLGFVMGQGVIINCDCLVLSVQLVPNRGRKCIHTRKTGPGQIGGCYAYEETSIY